MEKKLERLISIGPALAQGLDLETVLRRVVEAAREVTGARYAALGVLDEDGRALERFIPAGLSEEEVARIGDLPRGRGVLGELISHPEPLRLANVGDHPRSYGFPVGHPPMRGFLGVPIRVRGAAYGNLYLTEKQDGEFDETDEQLVVRLAEWAGIAIDHARLFGSVEQRRVELERTVEALETNVELMRAVGTATELEPVLALIVKRARALVDARGLALALLRGDELVVTDTAGAVPPAALGLRIPWQGGSRGDLPAEFERLLANTLDAQHVLAVSMVFRDLPLGAIVAGDRLGGGPFTVNEKRLMHAFAASASIVIASAQRATQHALRQSIEASERERARWARELHDETLQDVGALRMLLASARKSDDPDAVARAVDDAVERLGEISGSLRELISDLRPAVLDQLGLAPALEALTERVNRDSEIAVGVHVDLGPGDGRGRLAPDLELAVYRVAQEAVTNAVKHSGADRIEVAVNEADGAIEMSVRDDGRGFDPSASHEGFGLTGIRERIDQHGGTLDVASGPHRGTVLHVRLPARREATAPASA